MLSQTPPQSSGFLRACVSSRQSKCQVGRQTVRQDWWGFNSFCLVNTALRSLRANDSAAMEEMHEDYHFRTQNTRYPSLAISLSHTHFSREPYPVLKHCSGSKLSLSGLGWYLIEFPEVFSPFIFSKSIKKNHKTSIKHHLPWTKATAPRLIILKIQNNTVQVKDETSQNNKSDFTVRSINIGTSTQF